jgi:purine-binding chemotaxis protein CheW
MNTPAPGSETDWEEVARAAGLRHGDDAERSEVIQLLAFQLADVPYALPVERVREIVRFRPVTPVPRLPPEVLGVISLRGEIVQVVDLRRRLGLTERPPVRASRVIVVHGIEGGVAGLLVDAVSEVLSTSEDALRPPSGELGAVQALCVREDRFVSVLDLERVLAFDAEQ